MTTPWVVLHVCTGNICRSPMAELIMRDELDRHYGAAAGEVVLDGAGTYDGHAGGPIHPPAGRALEAYGIDASPFRAQALTAAAVRHADLVVCASREHVRRVLALVPEAADRTFTLRDLARSAALHADELPSEDPGERLAALVRAARADGPGTSRDSDVEDPYGLSAEVYAATAAQIRGAVRAVVGAG